MNIHSTKIKKLLEKFIENNRENFSIQLKRKYPLFYNKLQSLNNNKQVVENLYILLNGHDEEHCVVCGSACKFNGFYKRFRYAP